MEGIRANVACSLNRRKYGNLGSCDVRGDQNPQCYCEADEAYFCNYCEESVHGVNSVKLSHDRETLDRDESVHMVPHIIRAPAYEMHPSQIEHGSFNGFNFPCRKFRSFHKNKKHLPIVDSKEVIAIQNSNVGGIAYTRDTKGKQEPDCVLENDLNMSELSSVYNKCTYTEPSLNCSSFHEVPVLARVAQGSPPSTILADACRKPTLDTPSEDASECNSMGFIVPDHCNVDDYLVSNTDLLSKEEEVSVVSSPELALKAEDKTWWESEKNQCVLQSSLTDESHQNMSYNYERYFNDDLQLTYLDLNVLKHRYMSEAEYGRQTFVPLLRVCEKLKVERADETEQINQLLEAKIGWPLHITSKEARNQKSFNLRLNFEDVLRAWSDRGCFTTDSCQWPRNRPDFTSGSTDELSLDVGIVPVIEPKTVKYSEKKEGAQAFETEKNGGREARVMRYKEKRQTRFFSKTIRYEVRKMNADRRPRIKGRFVKRRVDVQKP